MNDAQSSLDKFITEALERAELTVRTAADRIGVTFGFVAQVKRGHSRFPPEHFQRWCDALSLTPAQRDEFLRLTLLARCPPEIQRLVADLEKRNAELSAALSSQQPPRKSARTRRSSH